jgi:FkbH-like protein
VHDIILFGRERGTLTLPAADLAAFEAFRRSLRARTTILWGEHCSECAQPACYASCAFYTPRADLHCRRFAHGFERIETPGGLDLVQVAFRRWGKLEGRGPVRLRPAEEAAARERSQARRDRLLHAVPLPRRARAWAIWRANRHEPAAPGEAGPERADAFVVETWLPPDGEVPFTVTFVPVDKTVPGLHQARFVARAGYARTTLPVAGIAAGIDLGRPFLVQVEPVDPPDRPVVFGLVDFVACETAPLSWSMVGPQAPAKAASKAKCVVFDLDDTLWRGTLAEDGPEGVTLDPEIPPIVRALDARGILLSVVSKNDPEPGMAALQRSGLEDYFLFPQIGWGPKSEALARLAARLDIGLDTFLFVDDQAFERAEVLHAHPAVEVVDASHMGSLLAHPRLDVPVTAESRRRRSMYRTEAAREAALTASGQDYLAFLRGCAIELEAAPLDAASLPRVHELTQRTNQLNFSAERCSLEALEALAADRRPLRSLVLRCRDRFGDYGIVGFVVTDPEAALVESFFMSCRVQRKKVEHAVFAHLARELGPGHRALRVRYRASGRNAAARRLLEELGFASPLPDAAETVYERALRTPFPDADVARLRAPELAS